MEWRVDQSFRRSLAYCRPAPELGTRRIEDIFVRIYVADVPGGKMLTMDTALGRIGARMDQAGADSTARLLMNGAGQTKFERRLDLIENDLQVTKGLADLLCRHLVNGGR
jgi:hypothetical protein